MVGGGGAGGRAKAQSEGGGELWGGAGGETQQSLPVSTAARRGGTCCCNTALASEKTTLGWVAGLAHNKAHSTCYGCCFCCLSHSTHLAFKLAVPALRLSVEFHLFLTALSVRPGSSLAMADHLLPLVSWAWWCGENRGREGVEK